jgi:hypothetical protein
MTVEFIGLDEKVLVEATLEQLREKNYSLNYKQYMAQEALELEDGFQMVKLGDVCSLPVDMPLNQSHLQSINQICVFLK